MLVDGSLSEIAFSFIRNKKNKGCFREFVFKWPRDIIGNHRVPQLLQGVFPSIISTPPKVAEALVSAAFSFKDQSVIRSFF